MNDFLDMSSPAAIAAEEARLAQYTDEELSKMDELDELHRRHLRRLKQQPQPPATTTTTSRKRKEPHQSDVVSKSWVFTINNYTDDDIKWIQTLEEFCPTLLVAKEVGEQGTPHLQGEITFASAKRWSGMKKMHPTWHFEKKNSKDFTYTLKFGNDMVVKKHTQPGQRNDLQETATIIREQGLVAAALAKPEVFMKYHSGMQSYYALTLPHRDRHNPPTVYWWHGKAGTGKSAAAVEFAEERNLDYYVKDNSQWWNLYTQQPVVILDDFNASKWDFRDLLKLLDRYRLQVQVKGGYMPFNSPFIIITCEFSPQRIWGQDANTLEQVTRRCTEIRLFEKVSQPEQ